MFASGELQRLIDLGLRGMTSNPTIFEKAIGSGSDYDEQLRTLIGSDATRRALRGARDPRHPQRVRRLRAALRRDERLDGYVSLEVSPTLAHDTQGDDRRREAAVEGRRPPQRDDQDSRHAEVCPRDPRVDRRRHQHQRHAALLGRPYEAAANAYIDGLEDRVARAAADRQDRVGRLVFVSRIDTAVDKTLEAKIAKGDRSSRSLLGKDRRSRT
jgi:hypothetical protein